MWTCTTFLLCTWSVPLRWHHSRPMTMTSTTSPLCSSTYCSVFGGNIRRPLALRMLISRLLIWFPVLCAQGSGSWWCHVSIQRWYSGRGSNFTSQDSLALMMVGRGSRIPCIFLNAGITKRLQVTTADTGLPGRAKISFLAPSVSKVANVVGKPGFINTRPKWIWACRSISSTCFR